MSQKFPALDGWSDETQAELCALLQSVATTPLKVKILQFFWSRNDVWLTTQQLAEALKASPFDVREAVQQLANSQVLKYVPFFGFSDICRLTPEVRNSALGEHIKILCLALSERPDEV